MHITSISSCRISVSMCASSDFEIVQIYSFCSVVEIHLQRPYCNILQSSVQVQSFIQRESFLLAGLHFTTLKGWCSKDHWKCQKVSLWAMAELCREVFGTQDTDWMGIFFLKVKNQLSWKTWVGSHSVSIQSL